MRTNMTLIFIVFLLFDLHITNVVQAQSNSKDRQQMYMRETYGLTTVQLDRYEIILKNTKKEMDKLKDERLSSKEYVSALIVLFKGYEAQVAKVFDSNQYNLWCNSVMANERYQVLSEDKFIPKEQMYALHMAEQQWMEERRCLWKSSEKENVKHEKNSELLKKMQGKIRSILGIHYGDWYIEAKALHLNTLRNMDKYGASYKEAYKIAEIEYEYSKKRKAILAKNIKYNSEREEELICNDEEKLETIKRILPSEIANKWASLSYFSLDYALKKRYGLNKSQITQYKNAYNIYTIEEYRIIYEQKDLTSSEKKRKLSEANTLFCETVRPLFKADAFTKWEGRRLYDFERRVKQKSLKF